MCIGNIYKNKVKAANKALGELGENGTGRKRNWANFGEFGRRLNLAKMELGENGIRENGTGRKSEMIGLQIVEFEPRVSP